jgi:hypothetical protein
MQSAPAERVSSRAIPATWTNVHINGVSHFHIAEINIARARAPLDDPLMASFVRQLDETNALADRDPGFVWRLAGEAGEASSYVQAFDDPHILINLSVWKSIDELFNYTYRSAHTDVFRARREWFVPMELPHLALWWIPAGTLPTIEDGKARLVKLATDGPTPFAFTFKQRFPPPVELVS